MPQLFKPAPIDRPSQDTNLGTLNDVGDNGARGQYTPYRTLKNSVASSSGQRIRDNDFDAQEASIPDAFGTSQQPKMKFLFTVKFFPRSDIILNTYGDESMEKMVFALKTATRPQPQVVYQDVNFYGFRTKVATRMEYGTVSLTFYDDVTNNAHIIASAYLKAISPISRFTGDQADDLDGANNGAIGIGPLSANKLGPFQYMRVTHHMIDSNDPYGNNSHHGKQVFYDYLNPKISNMNLDDLDMTASDVNIVELTFVYDSVHISYSDIMEANPIQVDASNNPIIIQPSNIIPVNNFGIINPITEF